VAGGIKALRLQQLLGARIVERGPLQFEEQKLRLQLRAALLDALQQRPVGRILRVDGEAQRREVPRAPGQVGDRLQLGDGLGEARPVQLGDAARVALGEDRGALGCLVQQAVGARLALAADERLQVPCDVGHAHHAQDIRPFCRYTGPRRHTPGDDRLRRGRFAGVAASRGPGRPRKSPGKTIRADSHEYALAA
jgi:hypothetical protein